jgi:hypothetical protein
VRNVQFITEKDPILLQLLGQSFVIFGLNETRSGRTGFSGEFSGEFSVGLPARRDVVSQPAT